MMLCDEFPDCTGFEINDFGSEDEGFDAGYWMNVGGTNSIAAADRPANRVYDNIGPKDPVTGKFDVVKSTQIDAVLTREASCGYPEMPANTPESRTPPGLAGMGLDANTLQVKMQKKCDEDCLPHTPSNDNKTPSEPVTRE